MASLFNEEFLRTVRSLRIAARRAPAGDRHAEHRSTKLGTGMEFHDFRNYVPGDDMRRVDWNLYRRSGTLFLRLFEETQYLPVYILLDASESMFFETPPRVNAGRQMAGILAAISLNQHDEVALLPFGDGLRESSRTARGERHLQHVLADIETLGPLGRTNLPRAIHQFNASRRRSGLVAIISDFFDTHGIDEVVGALGSLRHRLLVVQLTKTTDANPPLEGDVQLIDCETDSIFNVSVTQDSLRQYREAYQDYIVRLKTCVARRGGAYLTLDTDRPVLSQLRDLFTGGVLNV